MYYRYYYGGIQREVFSSYFNVLPLVLFLFFNLI